ncbi:hypothetical protein BROUX41_002357 [Berkeleyomyces rouxiae]|uniref:uncharacterized protein n=1 Tax=Berkeleyomyces rouxiae TaxID=2035830 RepID=UPI003B7E8F0C
MRPPRIITLVFFLTATLFLTSRFVAYLSAPGHHAQTGPNAGSDRPASPEAPKPTSQPHRQILRPPPAAVPVSPSRGWSFNEISRRFTLFPPLALVTLMDDNNTAFSARPAAFGPYLEVDGLSGQLWVGSSFNDDNLPEGEGDGELGCSDIPNWGFQIPAAAAAAAVAASAPKPQREPQPDDKERVPSSAGSFRASIPRHISSDSSRLHTRNFDTTLNSLGHPLTETPGGASINRDDGTDDYLHQSALAQMTPSSSSTSAGVSIGPSDIRSMQETAEIAGKIVLLSRGGCGFLEKIKWAQRRGALALIVGDNRKGGPLIQMYARGDTSNVSIPSIFVSHTTGQLLSALSQPGSFIEDSVNEFGRPSLKVQHSSKASGAAKAKAKALKTAPAPPGKKWPWEALAWDAEGKLQPAPAAAGSPDDTEEPVRQGLWITITPSGNASSFLDTILIVFVSPVITLTVVYTCVMLRTRIQNQRWRVPKSLVQRLPVRTYHRVPYTPSPLASPRLPSPTSSSPTTPLLQSPRAGPESAAAARLGGSSYFQVAAALGSLAQAGSSAEPAPAPRPKPASQWPKYKGRQFECVVCLEEYVDGVSQVMGLPCGHEFHEECITPWLTNRRRTCPICKGDVVQSLQHRDSDSESLLSSRSSVASLPFFSRAVAGAEAPLASVQVGAALVDVEAQASSGSAQDDSGSNHMA